MVPVLGSVGGSGRSTVAALIAAGLSTAGSCVVLDLAHRLASPWPSVADPGQGLVALPPTQPLTPRQVRAAASSMTTGGAHWNVLTDHQPWDAAPLPVPDAPGAWHQLAAAGGWQVVIPDTTHPVAHDVVLTRSRGGASLTSAWYGLPYTVPVLAAATTATGMRALQTTLQVLDSAGLPLGRTVVALVSTGDGRTPAAVRAGATMLEPRVGALVRVGYDPEVRATGLSGAFSSRSLDSAAALGRAVLACAHKEWGEPLPAALVPAPLPAAVPAARS
ncbi:hypothetical protein ACIGZJ_36035 [Kitasatospora sp. NPDC052868]|uniref:hypothetical protein n=1 Tax=Kitasatospora sp. NPDC052868 TaxID=3364060 RepID=UPI0037C81D63